MKSRFQNGVSGIRRSRSPAGISPDGREGIRGRSPAVSRDRSLAVSRGRNLAVSRGRNRAAIDRPPDPSERFRFRAGWQRPARRFRGSGGCARRVDRPECAARATIRDRPIDATRERVPPPDRGTHTIQPADDSHGHPGGVPEATIRGVHRFRRGKGQSATAPSTRISENFTKRASAASKLEPGWRSRTMSASV